MKETTNFVLQYHFWEKVRGSTSTPPSSHWDLRFDIPKYPGLVHFYLLEDPTKLTQLKAVLKPWAERERMSDEGRFPPGTAVNPTKDLPAIIKILDRGALIVLQDTPQLKEVEFKGNLLKGRWSLTKDLTIENWKMKKTRRKAA
jgi:hypothetical protein